MEKVEKGDIYLFYKISKHQELTTYQRFLHGIIEGIIREEGECFKTNKQLITYMKPYVSLSTVSRAISKLISIRAIFSVIDKTAGNKRELKINYDFDGGLISE